MRKIIQIGLLYLLISTTAFALLTPHNQSNDISCSDCHGLDFWPGPDGVNLDPFFLTKCDNCHKNDTGANYTRDNAPMVKTHSSAVIGGNIEYGVWKRDCWDCHGHELSTNPRINGQYTVFTRDNAELTTTFILDPGYAVNDMDWNDISKWKNKNGVDRDRGLLFGVRYGTEDQTFFYTDSFEIIDAFVDGEGTKIKVQGLLQDAPSGYTRDDTFELYYGQMIRKEVNGRAVTLEGPLRMAYNEKPGQIDPTPNGICQVCHTQTEHWRNDGTKTEDHYSGEDCIDCHSHTKGFKPRCDICHGDPPTTTDFGEPDGLVKDDPPNYFKTGATTPGEHDLHVNQYGFTCESCHLDGMPVTPVKDNLKIQMGFGAYGRRDDPDNPHLFPVDESDAVYHGRLNLNSNYIYEGTGGADITLDGQMVCDNIYCHSQGKQFIQGFDLPSNSPAWTGTSPDPQGDPNTCNNCHGFPPTFDSHLKHRNVGQGACDLCHQKTVQTTQNGETIVTNKSLHVNGQYEVFPGSQFYARKAWHNLDFEYTPRPAGSTKTGGTCSSNTCHQFYPYADPKDWINDIQQITSATMNVTQGSCLAGATEGTITVAVSAVCPKCTLPYACDIDWGDNSGPDGIYGNADDGPGRQTISNCTTTVFNHTYPDQISGIADPDGTIIGMWDISWSVRDQYNVSTADDMTKRVEVCPKTNVLPVPSYTYALGPGDFDLIITDRSTDEDWNVGTHSGDGMIRIEWGGACVGSTGACVTEEPRHLEDVAIPKTYTQYYKVRAYYTVKHAIKDNATGSSWQWSPNKLIYVTR